MPVQRARTRASKESSARNRRTGSLGEDQAVAHLRRLGYRILARNVRGRLGEIDVVAFAGDTIVFVEVKSARAPTSTASGHPEPEPLERLTPRQRRRLRGLAAAWLADTAGQRPSASAIRFDAIGVLLDRGGALVALEHLEGAW